MGRPQKNNADYYPHYAGLRNHRKIKMLRNKFGSVLGYAFWSMMLEWLTEHDGLEWEYSEIEIEMFASELGVSDAEIPPIIDYCIKIELLFKNNEGFIFSESLNENLTPVFEKRKVERNKSKTRERRGNGKFISTNGGVSDTEMPHSKVEYSKEKEISIVGLATQTATVSEIIINKEVVPYKSKKESFIKLFNNLTGREFQVLNTKADRQFKKLLDCGKTSKDFTIAIKNATQILKENGKFTYLTPEYITRDDKFDFYINATNVISLSAVNGFKS